MLLERFFISLVREKFEIKTPLIVITFNKLHCYDFKKTNSTLKKLVFQRLRTFKTKICESVKLRITIILSSINFNNRTNCQNKLYALLTQTAIIKKEQILDAAEGNFACFTSMVRTQYRSLWILWKLQRWGEKSTFLKGPFFNSTILYALQELCVTGKHEYEF